MMDKNGFRKNPWSVPEIFIPSIVFRAYHNKKKQMPTPQIFKKIILNKTIIMGIFKISAIASKDRIS